MIIAARRQYYATEHKPTEIVWPTNGFPHQACMPAAPRFDVAEQQDSILVFVVRNLTPYRVNFLERLASDLPEHRIAVVVTGGRPNQPWEVRPPTGVVVIEIPRTDAGSFRRPRSAWMAWCAGGRILSILQAMRPTAVVVHGYDDPAHARVIRGCHRFGIPVALRGDSNIRSEYRKCAVFGVAKRSILRFGFRYVDAFVPVGSNGSAYFRHYGASDSQIFVVPLEPMYALFGAEPDGANVAAFQETMALLPSRRRLLYVGRLVPAKRVDMLIRAFQAIASIRPTWDLVISGDGPLRATLRGLIPHSLHDRVKWTGFLQPSDLRLAYASADILVLPSESEPWGLVVNEAIAAGLATVVSDAVGAGADLIPDEDSGWVFPRNDHEALVAALTEATDVAAASGRVAASQQRLRAFHQSNDAAESLRAMLRFIAGK